MQAAVRSPAAPWREVLQRALQANQACRHSRYVQLATVRPDGRPANRTIVYRGQLEGDSDTLTFVTDARSRKVEEIAHCPWGEVRCAALQAIQAGQRLPAGGCERFLQPCVRAQRRVCNLRSVVILRGARLESHLPVVSRLLAIDCALPQVVAQT